MTATVTPVVPSGGEHERDRERSLGLVVDLPDRLLVAGVAVCVVVSLALVAQAFRPGLVLPAAAVAALLAQRLRPVPLPPARPEALATVLVVLGVAAWVLVNLPYRAEDVVVTRDPGNYTLTALWLVDNPSPRIPLGQGGGSAQGFDAVAGSWHPHGLHLVPALAAVGGWAGGRDGVLSAGLVLGGIALLAVFAVARRLCGGMWALLPVAALASSLPFLHVARSMYTEPLALALLCAGAVGLVAALRGAGGGAWVLAGSGLGAVALTRIDGTLPLVGATALVGLLALGSDGAERRRLAAGLRLQTASALPLVALGLADGWVGSRPYLVDHGGRVLALTALLAATCAVAVLLAAVPLRPARAAARGLLGPHAGAVVAALLALVLLALLSRPWWYVSRAAVGHPHREALQRAAGVPVDGTRTYDELSLTWLSWYWGWPAVLLGLAGLVTMTAWGLSRRDRGLLALVALVVPSLLLYSVRVSIFPDQVWAVRRFLPVVLPGLLVAAAWLLARAWAAAGLRLTRRLSALALAALVAAWPVPTLPGLWDTVEWDGRLAAADRLCDALPAGPVVTAGPFDVSATVRVVCGADVTVVPEPTRAALAEAVRRAGGGPLPLVTAVPASVRWDGPVPAPAVDLGAPRWEQTLLRRPQRVDQVELAVTLGTVTSDGTVTPAGTVMPPGAPAAPRSPGPSRPSSR